MNTLVQKKTSYRKLFLGMLLIVVLLFVSYSYAIASTTFAISDMKTKNLKIANIQTDITELELAYASQLEKVSLENASQYGLHELARVSYISISDTQD